MEILDSLKFVRGAVSTKDFVPEMKHFVISGGQVRAYNGQLAISCPIDLDMECSPAAAPLVTAIGHCQEVTALSLSDNGRLRVQSGRFRALIECIEGEMPHQLPSGERIDIDGEELLRAFRKLQPFIGNDASRPWVNGILLQGQSAFATNNVCLVEYWVGAHSPFTANIPMVAVKEVERVGIPPSAVQIDEHSITFLYDDGRWIRSSLYSTEWPDIRRILDVSGARLLPFPEGFFEGLDALRAFLGREDVVYFRGGAMYSEKADDVGAAYQLEGLPDGCYRSAPLRALQGAASSIDLCRYPSPCPFQGDRLRGVILGLRL